MLLALDIGNTETTIGLFDGDALRQHWRLTTGTPRTPDELRLTLRQLLDACGTPPVLVHGVALCSVVPPVTQNVVDACAACFGVTPLVIDPLSPLPITLEVDEPATVGADRVVNTLAASRLHQRDVIVVDLGTATTYDCITAGGAFLGGVIQPGVRTSAETLFRRTSMLPATALIPPERAIGKNTTECIRAGLVFGTADAIDGIIRRIKREWPGSVGTPYVVATGGLATTFEPFCLEFDEVDPVLTLKGLAIAYSILAG